MSSSHQKKKFSVGAGRAGVFLEVTDDVGKLFAVRLPRNNQVNMARYDDEGMDCEALVFLAMLQGAYQDVLVLPSDEKVYPMDDGKGAEVQPSGALIFNARLIVVLSERSKSS